MRAGLDSRSSSSRFIWPMPCSAEIEPPAATTRSWTKRVTTGASSAYQRSGSAPAGARTWKWTLPSPRWPKPRGVRAGKARLARRRRLDHEARHRLDRHRDVVLRRRALRALGVRDRIADAPERLGLRLARRDRRIGDQPVVQRLAEQRLEQPRRGRRRASLATASISTCHGCAPASGARVPGRCASTGGERLGGQQLEALDRVGAALPAGAAAPAPPPGRATPTQATARARDRGHQPQRRGGDDAQRPLRADQQLLEVVAAIVLLQRRQPVVDRAVGQHRLDARRPARASCRSAAPACRRRWSRPARRSSRCPRAPSVSGKRRPAPAPPRAGRRGSRPPPPPPAPPPASTERIRFIRRSDRISADAVRRRRRAADHRGVAALRHQRHAMRAPPRATIAATSAVDVGLEQRRARAVIAPAPVGQPRRDQRRGSVTIVRGAEPRRRARPSIARCGVMSRRRASALDSKFIVRSTACPRPRACPCRDLASSSPCCCSPPAASRRAPRPREGVELAQLTIHERIVIRVPRMRRRAPCRADAPADRVEEKKGPKCVAARSDWPAR